MLLDEDEYNALVRHHLPHAVTLDNQSGHSFKAGKDIDADLKRKRDEQLASVFG